MNADFVTALGAPLLVAALVRAVGGVLERIPSFRVGGVNGRCLPERRGWPLFLCRVYFRNLKVMYFVFGIVWIFIRVFPISAFHSPKLAVNCAAF